MTHDFGKRLMYSMAEEGALSTLPQTSSDCLCLSRRAWIVPKTFTTFDSEIKCLLGKMSATCVRVLFQTSLGFLKGTCDKEAATFLNSSPVFTNYIYIEYHDIL